MELVQQERSWAVAKEGEQQAKDLLETLYTVSSDQAADIVLG